VASPTTTNTAGNPNQAFGLVQGAGVPVVTVNSPPVVNFTVVDADGSVLPSLTKSNVRFAMAKLVRVAGLPDQWQSYLYTNAIPGTSKFGTTLSTNVGSGAGSTAALASAMQATTETPTADSTTSCTGAGCLTYNATGGYYTYNFATDIKDTTKTNGVTFAADGTTTYRVAIQMSYVNKAGATVLINPYFDFTIGADGKAVPVTDATKTRKVVDVASCNECHSKLALHGGGRVDPQFCVMCHNPGTTDPNSGNNLDFKSMVHKIHMGERLRNDYTIWGYLDSKNNYNGVTYPQDQANCTKCHDGSATATHKTPQGDNWMSVPSRAACGACHDGINFATGGGITLDGNAGGKNGHVGGAQADDTKCVLCHSPTAISTVYHTPVNATTSTSTSTLGQVTYYSSSANTSRLPAGVISVSYDIKSVQLDANRHPQMTFRMLQNGAPVAFNTPANPSDTAIWPNFVAAPGIYFAFSVPQDGEATPADFNVYYNAALQGIWNGSATGTSAGTLSTPDGNGYYTVTLTGRTIPTNASMLTGAIGYTAMLQTNVPGYTRTCTTTVVTNCVAGFNVPAQDVKLVATGFTARRVTTEAARCNLCHEKLGIFAESNFHSGQRNDPSMCAMCHNPNRTSSGWTADSGAFVHRIHAASKRTVPDNWHAVVTLPNGTSPLSTATLTGTELVSKFADITYPGVLNNCVQCHAPGGYDFSAGAAQVGNRLYRVVASGAMATANTVGTLSLSPYVTAGTTYGSGYNSSDASTTTAAQSTTGASLVNSPIANNCFACHDGDMASQPGTTTKAHFVWGGGSIYRARGVFGDTVGNALIPGGAALDNAEQCLACHSPTGIAPIKTVHGVQ
jgi:OmcA/MtrC family decaheme c-type cytochrome